MIDAEWIFNEILKLLNSYYGIYSKPINGTRKIIKERFWVARGGAQIEPKNDLVNCIVQSSTLRVTLHDNSEKCQIEK